MKEKTYNKLFYNGESDQKIYTLYALRFFLFLFIFVHHCYKNVQIPFLRQSSLAVSGFLILSGFLNGYVYKNKYGKVHIKEMFQFTKKRVLKFYALHLLLLFVTIPLTKVFQYQDFSQFILFFKRLFCNLTLTQSFINNDSYYFSFNGVTWYLSTYIFLTILTIPMLFIIKKLNQKKHSSIWLILLSLLLFFITFGIVYTVRFYHGNEEFWLYVFPLSRIFEYFIGMIFGNLVRDKKIKISHDFWVFSFLEIFAIVLLLLFIYKINVITNYTLVINRNLNQWIIPMTFLIVIFSYQKGILSKLFCFKLLVYLGEISMYLYFIHQPLIRYINLLGNVVHYRYLGFYMLLLTIILGGITKKYFDNQRKSRLK